MVDVYLNAVTDRIIRSVIRVHQVLGPGFLVSIYHRALLLELKHQGLSVQTEHVVRILYRGQEVGRHRLDIVVENEVLVELKVVDALCGSHFAQVRSYLKAANE